ncbi:MAG TPA: heme o synthase [Streptosporangiaceae bacterium]|nr:heme o synthase [Streptosporangiaceae bacterium]
MTHVTGALPPAGGEPLESAAAGTRPAGRRRVSVIARSLFLLTKPRIIELLLVTTLPTMLLAQRGLPSVKLIAVTLIGGALAAGSANTLNCYIDRDIDAVMKRTSRRPLVARAGQATVKPGEALASGIVLGAASTLLLGLLANWMSAVLADVAILFYVFVYTLGLKRRTASNIVIGGAAGCFPVLVGWAAVTGQVSLPAVLLFAVIFFWTPPHFWALAMKFRDDYAAANVPMLPVVASAAVVARKIVLYSWAMVAATLALVPYAGWLYGACAAGLGGWFLVEAHRLRSGIAAADQGPGAAAGGARGSGAPAPMRLFHLSIAYLTLLFAVVAIASLLPFGRW